MYVVVCGCVCVCVGGGGGVVVREVLHYCCDSLKT